jgi:hypothetical protein
MDSTAKASVSFSKTHWWKLRFQWGDEASLFLASVNPHKIFCNKGSVFAVALSDGAGGLLDI